MNTPKLFWDHASAGFQNPPRTDDRNNVWADRIIQLANRLDVMDLPAEAVEVLQELFEEIGQRDRDTVHRVVTSCLTKHTI